ncbi:hypothetical protein IIC65_09755 [Candidatus Sumerlaeota bacterium]|nr:hypothetical protein [Candidatus Sumerlaeota bacterium]
MDRQDEEQPSEAGCLVGDRRKSEKGSIPTLLVSPGGDPGGGVSEIEFDLPAGARETASRADRGSSGAIEIAKTEFRGDFMSETEEKVTAC